MSPARADPGSTACPAEHWVDAEWSNPTPIDAKAAFTSPEQSKPSGPSPPHV